MLWKVTIHHGPYEIVQYANAGEDDPDAAIATVRRRLIREHVLCLPMAAESAKVEPANLSDRGE